MSTIQELFLKGTALLKDRPNPHLEAKLLLLKSASIPEEKFYSHPESQLSGAQERKFFKLMSKRRAGFPVAYLAGIKEFWSVSFRTYPGVMIPRPETELVVEKALDLSPRKDATIVDIGTGCGNIAIALAKELPRARIFATDISPKALRIARLNASEQKASNIVFVQGSIFSPLKRLKLKGQCDFIVSNPPYVSEEEWAQLSPEIRNHEPKRALVAGKTGLEFIQELIGGTPSYLKPGGCLLFEIGYSQKDKVRSIFGSDSRWTEVKFFKDLAGAWRVALGKVMKV